MSGEKWTPGPWTVETTPVAAVPGWNWREIAALDDDGNTFVIGEIFSDRDGLPAHPSEAEAEANARLIAAAPEMADLLRWIEMFADVRSKDESKVFARVNRGALRTIRDKARAALAQARGES